eukprot:8267225-Alexandrium_andersonii.AAC.1
MDAAMVGQIKKHLDYAAAAAVPAGESIDRRYLLPSRIILTFKGEKAKARWAVGGHMAPDAGEYR